MGMNIKNPEVERLAAEVAKRFGETKTEAIRIALKERLCRMELPRDREERHREAMRVLEEVIWPTIPAHVLGTSVTKEEEAAILGLGPHGV